MAEIKPFTTVEAEVKGRKYEWQGQDLSSPGLHTPNPPSMGTFPVQMEGPMPPPTTTIAEADQPFFDPVTTPYETIDLRLVNKQSVNKNEKNINQCVGGKPTMPTVIARDCTTKVLS